MLSSVKLRQICREILKTGINTGKVDFPTTSINWENGTSSKIKAPFITEMMVGINDTPSNLELAGGRGIYRLYMYVNEGTHTEYAEKTLNDIANLYTIGTSFGDGGVIIVVDETTIEPTLNDGDYQVYPLWVYFNKYEYKEP